MAGEPPSPLALCAVVVDYHGEDLLRALLASLAEASRVAGAAVRLRVVVVDNGRGGRCAQLCAEAPLPVERIDPASNLGFGAGVNRGAAGATEPWLLVLNSDVSIPPSFLVQLGGLLRQLPADVAALGPALRNPDGSAQPSVGEFPNLARSLLALVQPRERRKYVSPAAHRAGPVDWVTGACLVLRRSAFEALGGFDPGYFLYYEEVDLLARARERGWRTRFEPGLEVTHTHPFAQRAPDSRLVPVVRYSQMRWFRRHRPRWELWALAGLVTAWSLVGSIRRWIQGGPGVDFGAVRRAVRAGLRGAPGPELQERQARARGVEKIG